MYEQYEGGYMANRFRSAADWFVHSRHGDVHTVRVGTSGERAVDLIHELSTGLPAEINVAIESVRENIAWTGVAVSRNEIRDLLARLKLLLAGYGGVEFALFTGQDQLTLTPELEIVVYARSARWVHRLVALGLEERATLPAATWRPTRHRLAPAPELSNALMTAVKKLGLVEDALDIVAP